MPQEWYSSHYDVWVKRPTLAERRAESVESSYKRALSRFAACSPSLYR